MKLTKKQIRQMKKAWNEAQLAEERARAAEAHLQFVIETITGVKGHVDLLTGDGFGFTPEANDFNHIFIGDLIKMAELGDDITEETILKNLTL